MRFSRFNHLLLASLFCMLMLLAGMPGMSGVSARSLSQQASCQKISSFTPSSGPAGTSVTISGCGFTGTTKVTFNGVSATFTVTSDTQITAVVPSGAGSGKITVNTPTKTLTSATRFIVPPALTLSRAVGLPTSTVTVSGSNFGPSEAVDIYFDTTDEALVRTNAQGAFSGRSIPVPASAVPGTHQVSAVGRHSKLSAQAAFTVQTDWVQFHDGPDHTGVNPYENVLSPANVASLKVKWSAPTNYTIDSSPAVVNGVIYVGSEDGSLYAFNAQTGAQLWAVATGGSIYSSPAVVNGVVYVGSYNFHLYAYGLPATA